MSYLRKIGKKWYIDFRWNGKHYTKSLKVTSKKMAEDLQKKIDYELAMGTWHPGHMKSKSKEGTIVKDFGEKFKKYLQSRKKQYSYKTLQAYNYNLQLLDKLIGDLEISKVTPDLVEHEIIPYLLNNYKIAGVRHCLTHFRAIFTRAVDWGYIDKNPFSGRVPKLKRKIPRYLQIEEIEKLKEYFSKPEIPNWQGDMVFLALNTGLRKSELFNLKWENVDLFNEQLIFSGKGDKERMVPLNDKAMQILLKRQKIQHIEDRRVFWEIKHPDSITRAWINCRKRTGIKARFHDLRSTFASYYIQNGGNLDHLREILGHEDYNTVRIYETLSPESLQKNKNIVQF